MAEESKNDTYISCSKCKSKYNNDGEHISKTLDVHDYNKYIKHVQSVGKYIQLNVTNIIKNIKNK